MYIIQSIDGHLGQLFCSFSWLQKTKNLYHMTVITSSGLVSCPGFQGRKGAAFGCNHGLPLAQQPCPSPRSPAVQRSSPGRQSPRRQSPLQTLRSCEVKRDIPMSFPNSPAAQTVENCDCVFCSFLFISTLRRRYGLSQQCQDVT